MERNKLKFAIFGNSYQANNANSIQKIIALFRKSGYSIIIERDFANYLQNTLNIEISKDEIMPEYEWNANFAISLGGDGTVLKTAAAVADKGTPILGINMGHLGFLADILPDEAEEAIKMLENGNYSIEQRTLLKVSTSNDEMHIFPNALNEVAILKHDNSSMISIHTDIDGHHLTTYQADGLIIATPTGSTGYSLSVGGPIISPSSHSVVLTPVAPHRLNMRPIVLNDDITIALSIESRSHNFLLSVDGRSQSLHESIDLKIRRSPYCINFVKRKYGNFFDTIHNKLLWGV